MGAQYVSQVFPQALAARKILVLADSGLATPMGGLLFLPPETQGRTS